MAEDMRGKTDDLYSNDWSSDYFCFSLLNVPIKETVWLYRAMDDEIMESCLYAHGYLGGQSARL